MAQTVTVQVVTANPVVTVRTPTSTLFQLSGSLITGGGGGGSGDMTKAVYDTANRGYVNRAVLADSASAVAWSNITGTPSTFTPSAHASTHITGGSDVIPNFTSTANGLAPLSGGGTTNFLRADGTWAAPPSSTGAKSITGTTTLTLVNDVTSPSAWNYYGTDGTGTRNWLANQSYADSIQSASFVVTLVGDVVTPTNGQFYGYSGSARGWFTPPSATATTAGYVPTPPNNTTTFFRGDATFAATSTLSIGWSQLTGIPTNTTAQAGIVGTAPNDVNKFWRGDASWNFPVYCSETNGTFTVPAAGSTVAITVVASPSFTYAIGQTLFITDGTRVLLCEITVVTSQTSLTVKNQGYQGNSTSGTMATASPIMYVGPSVATATQPGFVPLPPNNTTTFLRGDATFSTPPSFAGSAVGYVPTSAGGTTNFLRADGSWAAPPGGGGVSEPATTTTSSFTIPAAGSAVTLAITAASWPTVGMVVEINDNTAAHWGFFEITTVTSTTSIAVTNRGYVGNPVSGTMASGAAVIVASPGQMTATQPGFAPVTPNDTTKFLRGDGTWAVLPDPASRPWKSWAPGEGNPPTTLYGVFGTSNAIPLLAYNDSATWGTNFSGFIPFGEVFSTNGAKVRIKWCSLTATTGNVRLGVAFERTGVLTINADQYGTQVLGTFTVGGTVKIFGESTLTIPYANMASAVAGDDFRLQFQRIGADAADTMVGDMQVLRISIESA